MNKLFSVFFLITLGVNLFVLNSSLLHADIYQYQDASGRVHFSDQPMPKPYRLLKTYRASNKQSDQWLVLNNRKAHYTALINRAAEANGLSPALVHAVVRAESNYEEGAISHAGAMGLMQLMPQTAQILGVDDPFDPVQNLHGGALYLRLLLAKFHDDLHLALAAYNAGENAVIRYGYQIPPYAETQQYVDRVIRFYYENL